MARVLSFVVLVAILLVMGALFFQVMAGFFVPLFLAVLLVVMFRPVHRWIVVRARGRERLAAGLTTLAILAIVMAPLILVLIQAGFEASSIVQHWDSAGAKEKFATLRDKTGLALPPPPVLAGLERVDEALDTCSASDGPDARSLEELSTAVSELTAALDLELATSGAAPAWASTHSAERLKADRDRLAEAVGGDDATQRVAAVKRQLDALR
ncbi:MAG: AI-2E family transporter, partial [Pirellulales bacterium]